MKDYRKIVSDALNDAVGIELKEEQYSLDLIEKGLIDSLAMMNMVVRMERISEKELTAEVSAMTISDPLSIFFP